MAPRPPLGLSVVARAPSGAETIWWSGDRFPYNRPQGLSFRTRRGEGFSDASCVLARDIRGDYVDLNLLDDAVIVGDDGSIAYEGRLQSTPRTFDSAQGHSIQPSWVGWMIHAQDRTFADIYIDRDLSKWGPDSVARRAALSTGGTWGLTDPTVRPDPVSGAGALNLDFNGSWTNTSRLYVEAMYDAGPGLAIGSVYYAWKIAGINPADANFEWYASLAADDITFLDQTANLRAAGPGTGTLVAGGTNRRYAWVTLRYDAAGGSANQPYDVFFTCVAVYGTQGLTKQGTEDPTNAKGYFLSDILLNVAQRFCPKLSTAGVKQNTTLISHWTADDITPFDAFQDLNKYALWNLAVWENKTLTFEQADLTDYDWEVRLSDPGVSTTLQGDDATDLRNGIVVIYDDVQTGKRNRLTPDSFPELADSSPTNPANVTGIKKWGDPFTLSQPCTQAMALQFGRMKLADVNQPKEAGTVTVQGHIRDRAGHWQPVWKVRAGDTIAITDFPNSRPRMVVETDYNHDSYTNQIAVDNTFHTIDAFIDRATLGAHAAGLV